MSQAGLQLWSVARPLTGCYDRRLATYLKPDLLVLDDFGLKQLPPGGPDDVYDVIDGRYERRSIVLTSNRAADDGSQILGNPLLAITISTQCPQIISGHLALMLTLANAAMDRLLDRAHLVTITGRSFPLTGRQADQPTLEPVDRQLPPTIMPTTALADPANPGPATLSPKRKEPAIHSPS